MNLLLTVTKRMLFAGMLLLFTLTGWTQVQKNGVKQGHLKVKFTSEMTSTLSQARVSSGKELTTGIQTFDAVAKKTTAKNMYRLFPYNPQHESKLRKHGLHLWYVVEIDPATDAKQAAAIYKNVSGVAIAEVEHEKLLAPYSVKDYTSGISTYETLPFNDPYLKDQWHYDNRGQAGFGGADANIFEAWTKTAGANNIVVAVHDEGVDVNHADLQNNIWINTGEIPGNNVDDDANGFIDDVNGYNFAKNKGAIDPMYHGTHVAGTIAAVNNNGKGVSGVAGGTGNNDGAKIMSLQIFGGSASIENTYIYAAHNGAVISQNSWGYNSPGVYEQSILDAIDYFVAEAGDYAGSPMKGGIVIFAAGNYDYDGEWYPGYHPTALTVASIGPEGKKASYSNFGAWVELSAPGGDQTMEYGNKNGVLSTIPNNQYAYMQGTSMACPHVSGIAALALANRTKQLTNAELWNKLVTGVVGIDQYNENYVGKLGSGAIDAALAIQNDQGIAPIAISNLAVTGIAQEFATLEWSVPTDEDDIQPLAFQLYYHTEPITAANLASATKTEIKNTFSPGSTISYEVTGLLGLTTYYFAVTSTDRWNNVSDLSNSITATTNEGPSIAVDENSQEINIDIDATVATNGTHDITILNQAAGILRWNHFMRHKSISLSYNAAGLKYPVVSKSTSTSSNHNVAMANVADGKAALKSNEAVTAAFESVEKVMSYWPTNIIGETDLTLTNSAAAKFSVTEPDGFNLTQVQMYLKHDPAKGPVIMEVYSGAAPVKANLIYAQEHSNWSASEAMAYITLNEQLYFEAGSTFWVVFHVPADNLFPLGIGYEAEDASSTNCFISFNLGATWTPLEQAINSQDFAWTMTAGSYNQHLGTYLTLEPGSGDVAGNENTLTTLSVDASTLINGSYSANMVLTSNDAQNRELRIPVNLNVSGHKPNLKHIDIADYGSVFQGTPKTLELVIENAGYGNFNNPEFSITNSDFKIDGYAPWQIKAREEVVVKIKFIPSTTGNINGMLNITNGDQSYQIALFGVGAETSKITITPESQSVSNVTIGDVVNAQVTVENTGAFPLKYFIPGYDSKGISDNWPSDYHSYGYKFRSNYASEGNPVAYEFQDISSTGTNITSELIDDGVYYTLDMGFEFPYYGQNMQTLYIAQKGFTTFDNSVRPINTPNFPGNMWSPKGIISPLGTYVSLLTQGEIFYQVEADRVIVQYDNIWDGWNPATATVQMVLYANGDIRFFYEHMELSQSGLNIFIEDLNQSDGILITNYSHPTEIYSGLALGFDYPGPNIITNVTNGSGILAPGTSANIDIELSTSSLVEGTIKRYVNFISNDPMNAQTSALIELEITNGGTPESLISTDTIAFGDVFQGGVRSQLVTIKNPGTASVDIASMAWVNDAFVLTGDQPTSIKPGLYKNYSISIPTANLASLEDWLSINYTDGSHDTIYVTGNVVVPPAINVDLSLLQHTLAYGETSTHPLAIENPGLAPLEIIATGKQWLSFEAPTAAISNTYTFEKHNTGGVYQWIDIRETGEQLPFIDFDNYESTFWRTLELPFPIEFYGVQYTSFKIGDNGIISFEDEPQASFFTDYIPSEMHSGPCIMPYWTFSGFSDYLFDIEDIGIFYQAYDDKFIITWSYFTNNFGGMGDPVSAQVIFYKNGTMKFQYKREEGGADITSHFGTIGLQKNSTEGLAISEYQPLDHGDGLAFVVVPAKKYVIAPGATLAGEIKLDAMNIYGGQYNESIKIETNVPGSENLSKPVELTVTGEAVVAVADAVDFGSKMVAFEFGSPVANYVDMNIGNSGSAPYDITLAQMADGTQGLSLQIWALVQGWFGPEWRWADISELYSPWAWPLPVFTVSPGDVVKARAVFAPSTSGNFSDDVVLTTSLGETRVTLVGTGFEPPVMNADVTAIEVVMNTMTEVANRSIAINNTDGKSDLLYEVSVDFGRATTARTSEAVATTAGSSLPLTFKTANVNATTNSLASYNRALNHSDKTVPDTYVGVGGSLSFTLATKYNAGPQGFNLSHIETWFRSESVTDGIVTIEVRAGGNSISTATKLGEGQLNFTGSGTDEVGAWHAIALNEPIGIYPNEDFYVIVTYPLGIEFPQGTIDDEPIVPGRYYYFSEGLWYNIQEVSGFATMGWLMYAAEQTAGNNSWLSIESTPEGTLDIGVEGTINILITGAYSQRGDQVANVVIKSNDPNNAEVRVPVSLHMNEAPLFTGAPDAVYMGEKEERIINVNVTDAEGDDITLQSAQVYNGVTHTFNDGVLSVTMTPDYGDEGTYTYTFIATDEFGASSDLTIAVEVAHTNRAPVYSGTTDPLRFAATGILTEYSIAEFFTDPDDDDFTYVASSANSTFVNIFISNDKFLVKPLVAGETTINFTVTDSHGATTTHAVPVMVDAITGLEDHDVNFHISTYPNPTKGKMSIHIDGEINSSFNVKVFNIFGVPVMEVENRDYLQDDTELDLSVLPKGIYLVEITDQKGKSMRRIIKE